MQELKQLDDKLVALVEQPSDDPDALYEQPDIVKPSSPQPESFIPVLGEVRIGSHTPSEQVFVAIDEAGVKVALGPEHAVLIANTLHKCAAKIQKHRKTHRRR